MCIFLFLKQFTCGCSNSSVPANMARGAKKDADIVKKVGAKGNGKNKNKGKGKSQIEQAFVAAAGAADLGGTPEAAAAAVPSTPQLEDTPKLTAEALQALEQSGSSPTPEYRRSNALLGDEMSYLTIVIITSTDPLPHSPALVMFLFRGSSIDDFN